MSTRAGVAMPSTTTTASRETIEARVRVLMACHVAIEPRGFDSEKERAQLHRDIDAALDLWARW